MYLSDTCKNLVYLLFLPWPPINNSVCYRHEELCVLLETYTPEKLDVHRMLRWAGAGYATDYHRLLSADRKDVKSLVSCWRQRCNLEGGGEGSGPHIALFCKDLTCAFVIHAVLSRDNLQAALRQEKEDLVTSRKILSDFETLGPEFEELAKEYARLQDKIANLHWMLTEINKHSNWWGSVVYLHLNTDQFATFTKIKLGRKCRLCCFLLGRMFRSCLPITYCSNIPSCILFPSLPSKFCQ